MGEPDAEHDVLKEYRRRPGTAVTAVRLDLDTEGFAYKKWGGLQRCKAGDWIVNNDGDVYTVDSQTFAETYAEISPGRYIKTRPVWAERARSPGKIETKEGQSDYEIGDYLVYNDADRKDGYAMSAEKFDSLYEPA